MSIITLHFTRRPWNPVSGTIRWSMPRTRFSWAISSHVIVEIQGWCYEAKMLHGVRPAVPVAQALQGLMVVKTVHIEVPNLKAGLRFARLQVGSRYDYQGAFGLPLAADRDWADPACWFCYELAAAILRAAGRPLGTHLSHVGETALLSLSPQISAA